jgi:hypothetical protein
MFVAKLMSKIGKSHYFSMKSQTSTIVGFIKKKIGMAQYLGRNGDFWKLPFCRNFVLHVIFSEYQRLCHDVNSFPVTLRKTYHTPKIFFEVQKLRFLFLMNSTIMAAYSYVAYQFTFATNTDGHPLETGKNTVRLWITSFFC